MAGFLESKRFTLAASPCNDRNRTDRDQSSERPTRHWKSYAPGIQASEADRMFLAWPRVGKITTERVAEIYYKPPGRLVANESGRCCRSKRPAVCAATLNCALKGGLRSRKWPPIA